MPKRCSLITIEDLIFQLKNYNFPSSYLIGVAHPLETLKIVSPEMVEYGAIALPVDGAVKTMGDDGWELPVIDQHD